MEPDERGLNDTRANACEIVAWRFLARLAERDAIDYVVYELPPPKTSVLPGEEDTRDVENRTATSPNEHSSLLPQFRASDHAQLLDNGSVRSKRRSLVRGITHLGAHLFEEEIGEEEEDPAMSFVGLNALEIAAVSHQPFVLEFFKVVSIAFKKYQFL